MAIRPSLTGSHLLAKSLELEGIENVFTLAGDHILPAMDVMSDQNFKFIDTRHEQAAVHMADAWGRITGRAGVAMYTTPGFSNAIPGLSAALHSESPVLSISGSAALNELGRGATQEIDQIGMAKPTTKGAWLVTNALRIPDTIAHALRVAYSGRRGPVHITIPIDIQQQVIQEQDAAFYIPNQHRSNSVMPATSELVKESIRLLKSSQRPIIIAGSAASYRDSGTALQQLIETTRIPLITEGDARGLVPDDHPYCFGLLDPNLNSASRLLSKADAIVLLGRKQDYIIQYAMPPVIAADAKIIQVDPSESEIGRNRGVAVGIVGDIQSVVAQMDKEAGKHSWKDGEWIQELEAERESQNKSLDSLAVDETPMHATLVHKTLRSFLKADDFLIFDAGDFCHFGRALLPALKPKRWMYFPPLGMLGLSLPTALVIDT